jgi:hypothetical protein
VAFNAFHADRAAAHGGPLGSVLLGNPVKVDIVERKRHRHDMASSRSPSALCCETRLLGWDDLVRRDGKKLNKSELVRIIRRQKKVSKRALYTLKDPFRFIVH